MSDLRLNLDCGAKHLEDYLNVDKYGDPDLKFDERPQRREAIAYGDVLPRYGNARV